MGDVTYNFSISVMYHFNTCFLNKTAHESFKDNHSLEHFFRGKSKNKYKNTTFLIPFMPLFMWKVAATPECLASFRPQSPPKKSLPGHFHKKVDIV